MPCGARPSRDRNNSPAGGSRACASRAPCALLGTVKNVGSHRSRHGNRRADQGGRGGALAGRQLRTAYPFADDFRDLELAQQGLAFRAYLSELYQAVQKPELDERTRQGMLLVQQVCEQLAGPVEQGDIPLSETLVVEIQRAPGVNLTDLLS